MKRPSDAGWRSTLVGSRSRSAGGPSSGDAGSGEGSGLRAANGGVGVATKVTCGPRGTVVVSPVNTSDPPVDLETPKSTTKTFGWRARYQRQGVSEQAAGSDEMMPPPTYNDLVSSPATSRHVTTYEPPDCRPDRDPSAASCSTSNVDVDSGGDGDDRLSSAALNAVLRELRLVTDKLRADEARLAICSDWKFAAMVVDRFCLILFSVFTVVSTFAILFSAPHGMA